ncbi:MAG: hypothetical protein CM15mP129_01720 [Chloroflexota bacterium]|nr:MAG: hypothetical protein CM15mP129_01720 [Chloroflexota bacterium]
MESKKNPKVDIGKNSSLYFALGMALMMFLSYSTINYKVYDKSSLNLDKVNMDALDEEEVRLLSKYNLLRLLRLLHQLLRLLK